MKKITPFMVIIMLLTSATILAVADAPNHDHDNNTDGPHDNHPGNNQTTPHDNETNDNNGNVTHNHDGDNETEGDHDNETEHEVEIMNTTLGAAIRLLQLEKALLTNLLKGAMTVQVLKGLNVNTTDLEEILDELHIILDTVQSADPAANNSVETFVTLKNETKNLTKQFRDKVRLLLDNETIDYLKELLKNVTSGELQNCTHKLRFKIRHFNRNQLYRLYGIIGEINNTLLNEYINGNISLNQTKIQIHKIVNQMTKEKRNQIFSELKEDNIKVKIRAHRAIGGIKLVNKGNGHGKH